MLKKIDASSEIFEYFRTRMRNKVTPKYQLSVFPQLELIEMMTDMPIIITLRPLIKSYHA